MYLGFKYNFLYVFTTVVSTHGAAYPRALQHLMVGVYLGELCLLGLFGIKVAIGPLVIVGVLTMATIIYHALLNRAIAPLLKYVPLIIFETQGYKPALTHTHPSGEESSASANAEKHSSTISHNSSLTPLPPGSFKWLYKIFRIDPRSRRSEPGSGNMVSRYIRVNTYSSPEQLSALMPTQKFGDEYDETLASEAYLPPIVTQTPVVWIAKDPLGISREEILKTDAVIHITDEGAYINEKNKADWDAAIAPRPVIWRASPAY